MAICGRIVQYAGVDSEWKRGNQGIDDAAMQDPAKRHELVRKDVREVVCALCNTRQPVAPYCRHCRYAVMLSWQSGSFHLYVVFRLSRSPITPPSLPAASLRHRYPLVEEFACIIDVDIY